MYHKCVKCGKLYERASEEIIVGCSCGSKLFYFVKQHPPVNKKPDSDDVEIFYELEDDATGEMTIFDIEAITVKGSGKYELNIESLMNNDGLIYKYGDGKYGIDLDANLNVTSSDDRKDNRRKKKG